MSDGFLSQEFLDIMEVLILKGADRGAVGVFIRDPNSYDRGIFNVNPRQTTCKYIPYSRREGEQPGDRFGHAVACGFGRYIVGAPGFNEGQGKAYLYADVRREHRLDYLTKSFQKMIQHCIMDTGFIQDLRQFQEQIRLVYLQEDLFVNMVINFGD